MENIALYATVFALVCVYFCEYFERECILYVPRVLAVGGKWVCYMFVKIQQQYNIEVMFFFVCLRQKKMVVWLLNLYRYNTDY